MTAGRIGLANRGVQAALLSAVLFGAGTPVAKLLLGTVSPWLLAGLLYCGSGPGYFRLASPTRVVRPGRDALRVAVLLAGEWSLRAVPERRGQQG